MESVYISIYLEQWSSTIFIQRPFYAVNLLKNRLPPVILTVPWQGSPVPPGRGVRLFVGAPQCILY